MDTDKNESKPLEKPAFQYALSVSIGVLVIILISATAYYGVFR